MNIDGEWKESDERLFEDVGLMDVDVGFDLQQAAEPQPQAQASEQQQQQERQQQQDQAEEGNSNPDTDAEQAGDEVSATEV